MKEISLEELEKAALKVESEEEIIVKKLTEAQKFILANDIKRGDTMVSASLIYETYKAWKKTRYQNKTAFFMDFYKYFVRKRLGHGMFYMLNPEPFDLSVENYWAVRKQIREENERKRKNTEVKRKNAEKSIQVSSIKPQA